jgi:hypothetical protein
MTVEISGTDPVLSAARARSSRSTARAPRPLLPAPAPTKPHLNPEPVWTAPPASFEDDAAPRRGETPAQRLDRNYAELLQEIRVAQTGVQLLLAFLLTLAFTPRFAALTAFQRHVYVTSLILGSAATALLIAPAPFHRMVFRRRLRTHLVRAGSLFALCGLALLMFSLTSALLLVLDVTLGTRPAEYVAAAILGWFGLWWYLLPLWSRLRYRDGYAGRARHSRTRPRY